jgi:hypothetical protein
MSTAPFAVRSILAPGYRRGKDAGTSIGVVLPASPLRRRYTADRAVQFPIIRTG